LTNGLRGMATTIPGIVRLVVRENKSSHSMGYTLGLVVRFTLVTPCLGVVGCGNAGGLAADER